MGHAAHHLDTKRGDVLAQLERVVLAGEDRVREVLADLLDVNVERGGELDVADVVAAEVDVHESGDRLARIGAAVVVHALDERAGAVADADDRHANLVRLVAPGAVRRNVAVAHCEQFPSEVESARRARGAHDGLGSPGQRVCYTATAPVSLRTSTVRGRAGSAESSSAP